MKPGGDQKQYQMNNSRNQDGFNNSLAQTKEEIDTLDKIKSSKSTMVNGTHKTLILQSEVWTAFPMSDRVLLKLKQCFKTKILSYVDQINIKPKSLPNEILIQYQKQITHIGVIQSSNLKIDPNIQHPFVKIHIVDLESGQYIKKQTSLYHHENLTFFDNLDDSYSQLNCDYLLPFATNCYDLRIQGNSQAKWNEFMYVKQSADLIINSKTVILFEILDFNKQIVQDQQYHLLDYDGYYRVAWGYLRPIGNSLNNQGKVKLQLYKYKFNSSNPGVPNLDVQIPHVYYDFIWPIKAEYDGYLDIQLFSRNRPQYTDLQQNPLHIFQNEKGDIEFLKNIRLKNQKNDDLNSEMKEILNRVRLSDEPCQMPKKILYKLSTSKLGCQRIAFSNNGQYLAAACTHANSKTVIKIFNTQNGNLALTLKGHLNLIHDLDWSKDDHLLISSSSDFDVKVWKIPRCIVDDGDEINSEKNNLVAIFPHISYVYSAKFAPKKQKGLYVFATACYDAKVRVFTMELDFNQNLLHKQQGFETIVSSNANKFDTFDNLLDHRHPNCMMIDDSSRIYVGDSIGQVHIWDLQIRQNDVQLFKTRVITEQEMAGDPINCINKIPNEINLSKLLIHNRDSCIRLIQHTQMGSNIEQRFIGNQCQKYNIRSVVSPDGRFLLSGSENGQAFIWNIVDNDLIDNSPFQLSYGEPVMDVAWSTNYHMIAVCGFGKDNPILVYQWKRDYDLSTLEYEKIKELKNKFFINDDNINDIDEQRQFNYNSSYLPMANSINQNETQQSFQTYNNQYQYKQYANTYGEQGGLQINRIK